MADAVVDPVVIVGGGISGLATAYYLGRAGRRSVIIEKAGRLGGLIQTDRMRGCDLEAGPDSFISTKTAVAELASDLGISGQIIGSNDSARRVFVVREGRLTPFPKGMSMMVPGEWGPVLRSPLLGIGTKAGLLRETLTRPCKYEADFSVGDLVKRHFGPEMLEYVTEPLLSGVYGGEAASLSARSVLPRFVEFEEQYGSLIRGVRKSARKAPQKGSLFRSFDGGMQTLTDAVAGAIQEHSQVVYGEASAVEETTQGWSVGVGGEAIPASDVVLACPAWASARLLAQNAPEAARELAAIPYSSAILAMLVFEEAQLGRALDGFGFLVPRREQQTIAAATWVNIKFPSRVPKGLAALRGFIVGARAESMAQASEKEVVAAVRQDFARLMGVRAVPVFSTVHAWPQSMPQYVVGHAERIQRLERALAPREGLWLTGNYFDGVGIPDSIRKAQGVAKQIAHDRV